MARSVGTRWPASPTAKEDDWGASVLRLPEVDVRHLRWTGKSGPCQRPRNAGTVIIQRAGKPAVAVDKLRRHLTETRQAGAEGSVIVLIGTHGEGKRCGQHSYEDRDQDKLISQIHVHVSFPHLVCCGHQNEIPFSLSSTKPLRRVYGKVFGDLPIEAENLGEREPGSSSSEAR